ncbi:hypothetical protein HMPREF0495_01002 [Levilactobacillus brevis ATCC 14869 = DSM 20054]|uniref:Uncharacterized protein n=1 Tax=Levilactobacillus brevis ATCC 14869 = DSM 20054 TaxID=649758 RepID=U2QSQ2_LEVBR|nr:hypothetical protein HMPREF0495_01002 [Levilactobacillus brevis ATCC 14869 = DSM 20054]
MPKRQLTSTDDAVISAFLGQVFGAALAAWYTEINFVTGFFIGRISCFWGGCFS